jgi:hypothetical protein
MQSRRQVVLGIGFLAVGGCARNGPAGVPALKSGRVLESVLIRNVPHVRQKPDFCGEAVAAGFAQALGARYEQDDVFDLSGMDPARGMGATTRELRTALQRMGFETGNVWYEVSANSADELRTLFDDLHADLERGVPSIVCMRYDERPRTTEHFRLVLGYDRAAESVVYHEPALDDGAYRTMPLARFLELWPLKYDAERWTVIRLRLAGRRLAELPAKEGTRPAEFAQHVMALRKRVPPGFHVVVEPPFVVVGDDTRAGVEGHARGVVRWAVSLLEREYFALRPQTILDIWLFKDEAGYHAHVARLFSGSPDTPFGFYSKQYGALVVNIATGGGTLVHEIVHPYVEANFPDCPPWFNEGLGSLYEQSGERNGRIIGLTNWRLAGLKRAIRERRTQPLRVLMEKSSDEFYGDETGLCYAESRYLLYYLQEHGLLQRYYTEFVKSRATDPAGYRTLANVISEWDLAAFQTRWEDFVLGLRFP